MIIEKKYKISSPFTEIEITYTAGILSNIEVKHSENISDFMRIVREIYGKEPDLIKNCTVKEKKISSQKQKIALWCQLYKMRYGNDYKVTAREAGMLKNVQLTQELITRFFDSKEWWAKEKTIARLTSNYNELKRISNNQQQTSGKSNPGTQANSQSLADEFQRRFK